MTGGRLILIGCGVSPADIGEEACAAVRGAAVLAGGRRLLDWFPEFGGERVEIAAQAAETARCLAERSVRETVAVLASGDALFFGIGGLFAAQAPGVRVTVVSNRTAAQVALARLQVSWEQARFFSVHGRTAALPWREILRAAPGVVYADAVRTPPALAAELVAHCAAAAGRRAALVEALGQPGERVVTGTLQTLAGQSAGGLSLLVVLGEAADGPVASPPLELGLPDEFYEHERGLITHNEVRAVALSKLRLGPGAMWDLGAGSGSVGLEAAGLCPGLIVHAVESRASRCAQIRRNAAAQGCDRIRVIEREVLKALDELPAPRCVFVGGGGKDAAQIVERSFIRLRPGGTLVVATVLLETQQALAQTLPAFRAELVEIAVRRAHPVGEGQMLAPCNPVQLAVYRKDEECAG